MILAFTAAWESSELSEACWQCIEAGRAAMRVDNTRFAYLLGVTPSRITAMREGEDPGPGFLRFATLPAAFWIGFLKEWGVRFAVRVITDHELDRQIAWLNFWMVKTMKKDAARKYPGQGFEEQRLTLTVEEREKTA